MSEASYSRGGGVFESPSFITGPLREWDRAIDFFLQLLPALGQEFPLQLVDCPPLGIHKTYTIDMVLIPVNFAPFIKQLTRHRIDIISFQFFCKIQRR